MSCALISQYQQFQQTLPPRTYYLREDNAGDLGPKRVAIESGRRGGTIRCTSTSGNHAQSELRQLRSIVKAVDDHTRYNDSQEMMGEIKALRSGTDCLKARKFPAVVSPCRVLRWVEVKSNDSGMRWGRGMRRRKDQERSGAK